MIASTVKNQEPLRPSLQLQHLQFISSFGWTLPLRWTCWGCQSAASISEPCLGPEWERSRRTSSSWTTCPPPSSTISLSTPFTTGLLSLWQSWTHTSRYEECVCESLSGAHCQSLTVCLLLWPWRSAAISWPRTSSPSACQFWRMSSTQTTVGPTWVWLRTSAVSS